MIAYQLTLNYKLSPGWLKPWVDGIVEGRTVGRRCAGCERVSFVPVRHCDCGCGDGEWIDLPGTATIVHRTDGLDGNFALVQFDGADTRTVVRLLDVDESVEQGHLSKPDAGLPALLLVASDARAKP